MSRVDILDEVLEILIKEAIIDLDREEKVNK